MSRTCRSKNTYSHFSDVSAAMAQQATKETIWNQQGRSKTAPVSLNSRPHSSWSFVALLMAICMDVCMGGQLCLGTSGRLSAKCLVSDTTLECLVV